MAHNRVVREPHLVSPSRAGSLQSPMTTHQSVLGSCPACGEPIPSNRLLIEYRADGRREMYAECPACRDVVHPR